MSEIAHTEMTLVCTAAGLYNTVVLLLQRHYDCCFTKPDVKQCAYISFLQQMLSVTTAATNGGSAMLNKHVYNKKIVSKVCA